MARKLLKLCHHMWHSHSDLIILFEAGNNNYRFSFERQFIHLLLATIRVYLRAILQACAKHGKNVSPNYNTNVGEVLHIDIPDTIPVNTMMMERLVAVELIIRPRAAMTPPTTTLSPSPSRDIGTVQNIPPANMKQGQKRAPSVILNVYFSFRNN